MPEEATENVEDAEGAELTGAMRLWIDSGGVLRAVTEQQAEISLDEALEFVEAARQTIGSRARPLLLDLRGLRTITRSARSYWISRDTRGIATCMAIVVERGPSRVVGHFLLGLDDEDHPVRLFATTAQALAWLEGS